MWLTWERACMHAKIKTLAPSLPCACGIYSAEESAVRSKLARVRTCVRMCIVCGRSERSACVRDVVRVRRVPFTVYGSRFASSGPSRNRLSCYSCYPRSPYLHDAVCGLNKEEEQGAESRPSYSAPWSLAWPTAARQVNSESSGLAFPESFIVDDRRVRSMLPGRP